MTNNIAIKQNEPFYIEHLAAILYLYQKAKWIRLTRVALTTAIPIVSVIVIFLNPSYRYFLTLPSAIWLFMNKVVFMELEKRYVKAAAKIQEAFDVSLFCLNWNDALVGQKIPNDQIHAFSQAYQRDKEILKNWYPNLPSSNHYFNVITVQHANIVWDLDLLKFYKVLFYIAISIHLSLLVYFGYWSHFTFRVFLLTFIVPSLPLLLHLVETLIGHRERITELERISELMEGEILHLSENEILDKCRQLQDVIFLKRCDIHTVPDRISWIKRRAVDNRSKKVRL